MLVGVDASGSAEQVDLGNSIPLSSLRVSNHIESQPSTQTAANETLSSGPHLDVDQLIELGAPRIQGAKNGTKGIKGRNTSLLTFNKKKGALESLKRSRPVRDSQAGSDAEQALELSESASATPGSMAFHSGPSIGTSQQDGNGNATAAEQTSHDDTEPRLLLADYEEQDQPCPASPNIE